MKRFVTFIVAAATLAIVACQDATGPGAGAPLLSQGPAQVAPNQYIVLFDRGLPDAAATAQGIAQAHGLTLRHVYGAAVKGFVGTIPPVRLDTVQADPRVLLVEAERAYELDVQQLPTGINRIEVDRNPSADIDQVDDEINLDVGMLDSGIDQDHLDLNVAGGINFAGGPASKWDDGNGHGTHTAGTVGAIDNGIGVVGVAPGVRLWAVRVCKNGGICMTGDMIAGINWMAAQKAADIDFAVANMSISTSDDVEPCKPSSGAVHQAICGLVNSGVVSAMIAPGVR